MNGTRPPLDKRHGPCLPPWDNFQHFDNYQVRSLGGNYDKPPLQVSQADLERAKDRLARFDVVLVLEELGEHLVQLEATFGWEATQLTSEAYNSDSDEDLSSAFSPEEEALLSRVNRFDHELYTFARHLAATRTEAALAAKRR